MAFVEKVALHADRITSADIETLRSHGYRDEEIFDVAAAAPPAISSASSSTRWAYRPIRPSTTSTPLCAGR
jgi:hypothetical protein